MKGDSERDKVYLHYWKVVLGRSEPLKVQQCEASVECVDGLFVRRVVTESAASYKGLSASSRQDALFLWELEKMDSATGRCAVYTVAISRPALVHLGTARVTGQFEQLIKLIDKLFNIDCGSPVGLTQCWM